MTSTSPTQTTSLEKVLTALAELGEATAAGVAQAAGLAYSTTTPKLRELEKTGHAEPFRAPDGRTLWRATDAGRATAVVESPDGQIIATDPPLPADAGTPADAPDETAAPAAADDGEHDDGGRNERDPAAQAQPNAVRPATGEVDEASTAPPEPDPAAQPVAEVAGRTVGGAARPQETAPDGQARRPKGALRGAVVDILENHPDQQFRIGELCKLINRVQAGAGVPKASPGAVANILHKLAGAGIAVQTVEKPATFQLARREA